MEHLKLILAVHFNFLDVILCNFNGPCSDILLSFLIRFHHTCSITYQLTTPLLFNVIVMIFKYLLLEFCIFIAINGKVPM